MEEKVLDKKMCDYSKAADIAQTILIALAALLVPTFLAQLINALFGSTSWLALHSQIIVGSIVNIALIATAINLNGWKKIFAVVTLPSISTILGGFVFKSASPFMAYMIPAIWLGNFAIIYLYKLLLLKHNWNYFLTGIVSIVVKVAIIFLGFTIINAFGVFPPKLVANLQNAMGLTQAITATIAMFISYSIYFVNKKKIKE